MIVPEARPPFPLRWGFTTRFEDPDVLPARRLSQVHGCTVVEASENLVAADGHWSMDKGRALGVRVADCVPVLLAGPVRGRPWVAALHAGWRGAVAGILRQGVGLYRDLGGVAEDLVWAFGPAIGPCHFEVGPEVIAAARQDPAWHDGLARAGKGGRPHLDLHAFLRAQALDLGMQAAGEASIPLCTYCREDLFYSFRRGDRQGRQWGLIEIL